MAIDIVFKRVPLTKTKGLVAVICLLFSACETADSSLISPNEDMAVSSSDKDMVGQTSNVVQAQTSHRVIRGTITQGVMCPALRGDNGELYTFSNIPDELTPGDVVLVHLSDKNADAAYACDQGLPSVWDQIIRPAANSKPEAKWISN